MAEWRQDDYQVTLDSGESIIYQIRGLRDDEIGVWSTFCASVFRYKPNPPPASYFERHFRNDPSRVASLIRVAFCNDQIVASCRLFLRTISPGYTAGGIGEVCTANDHRRRGLSKVLLQNVIEIMKERQLQVSLLHAAPAFFPVYEKAGGYVCSTSLWSLIPISHSKLQTTAASMMTQLSCRIRDASFPNDTDQLSKLHHMYSEQRLMGCIVRSKEYWNDYLSVELKGSLWILEAPSMVAWLSLRRRGDRFQLSEFGFDTETSHITIAQGMTMLLSHAVKEMQQTQNLDEDGWLLSQPTFLLDDCQTVEERLPFMDWHKVTKDNDLGWMYKILDDSISIESITGSQRRPHLIWPADSF